MQNKRRLSGAIICAVMLIALAIVPLFALSASAADETVATFELGANGSASHNDGSSKTTYSETVNGYTLNLTNVANMYTGARDAKGNSCIKLGASSKAGGFSFTVPDDVTSVIINAAKYKANATKLTVNGTAYTLTKNSNDGAYDVITVDTSATKTVTLTTVSGGYRCMVNSIAFVVAGSESPDPDAPVCEHTNYTDLASKDATCTEPGLTSGKQCDDCGVIFESQKTIPATGHAYEVDEESSFAPTCDVDGLEVKVCANCQDVVETEIPAAHKYVDGVCTECQEVRPSYAGRYYIATKRSSGGNYFYMTNDLGTAGTKRYQAVDSGLTLLPASIAAPDDTYIFVIEDNGDGTYYIYAEGIDGNNYLGWTSSNSGTLVAKASAKALTITESAKVEGAFNIAFEDGTRYLSLNNNSGNNYFAWYTGTQAQDLILIPIAEACDHAYDNACDTDCNVCGEERDITHAYDNDCDTDCNVCGEERSITHAYDNACDTDCNVCGEERAITHAYDNACDTDCNVCGEERAITHVYDNDCDTDCNVCGEERAITHAYDNDCDTDCNVCGEERAITHAYDNDCDTDCNVCGEERAITHAYVGGVCTVCGERVAITAAQVNVGVDLAIKYRVYIPDGIDAESIILKVTNTAHNTYAELEAIVDGNIYIFIYDGIAPQCMSDKLDAELIIDGEVVAINADYSVVQNAKNLARDNPEDTNLKQFLADLLAYGQAAQKYLGATVAITDDDIAEIGTPSTNKPTEDDLDGKRVVGEVNGTAYISGAGVRFDDTIKIYVTVNGDDALNTRVKVNGEWYAVENVDGKNVVYLGDMSITEISDALTIDLYLAGGTKIHTVTYGVYAYVDQMIAKDPDSTMAALAKALYNCAESAKGIN